MTTLRYLGCSLCSLGLISMAAAAPPSGSFSASYSSVTASTSNAPAELARGGTIWVSNEKMRTEYLDEGHVMAHILDSSKHTAYLMVPDQGFYEDDSKGGMPALPKAAPTQWFYDIANPCGTDEGAHCQSVGRDEIDGRVCDMWKFSQTDGDWIGCIDARTGILLRKVQGNFRFELTHVRVARLSPKLFELTPGLKKGGFVLQVPLAKRGPDSVASPAPTTSARQ